MVMTFWDLGVVILQVGWGQNEKGEGSHSRGEVFRQLGLLSHGACQFPNSLTWRHVLKRGCLIFIQESDFPRKLLACPRNVGRGKEIKPSSRPSDSIPLHLLAVWHSKSWVAKQANTSEQEMTFFILQWRHEGQGDQKSQGSGGREQSWGPIWSFQNLT